MIGARDAHPEGEGGCEVDQWPDDTGLPLGIEHSIEGADQCARHLREGLGATGGCCRGHLEVGLVEDVKVPERRMVRAVGQKEALSQVLQVQRLDLREANEVRLTATAGPLLEVWPIAHTRRDSQAQGGGLVQEIRVVVLGIVAIEAHEVGSELFHDPEVASATSPPHRHGLVAEPVVGRQRGDPLHGGEGDGAVADASNELGSRDGSDFAQKGEAKGQTDRGNHRPPRRHRCEVDEGGGRTVNRRCCERA
mmetsp:Transcript_156474/g.502094  ORF Transcript_156474/g.502094 Transcript_156474/m.502094 type:complete len:251 (-) Transcript_156474:49-801(-)